MKEFYRNSSLTESDPILTKIEIQNLDLSKMELWDGDQWFSPVLLPFQKPLELLGPRCEILYDSRESHHRFWCAMNGGKKVCPKPRSKGSFNFDCFKKERDIENSEEGF